MATFSGKVYKPDADNLVVDAGGTLKIGGEVVPASGTQAAAIADETAITGGQSPTEAEFVALQEKFNAVLAALRGVGIIASA